MNLPLLEDDLAAEGVIEPGRVTPTVNMPACAVVCFFGEVVQLIAGRPGSRRVTVLSSEAGLNPVSYTHLTLPTICSV